MRRGGSWEVKVFSATKVEVEDSDGLTPRIRAQKDGRDDALADFDNFSEVAQGRGKGGVVWEGGKGSER